MIEDPKTLRLLIDRLHQTEPERLITRPEHVTVEDVAEALELDADFVAAELDAILREREAQRLPEAIWNVESVLYSVERPGHDIGEHPLLRLQSIRQMVDENATRHAVPRRKAKVEHKPDPASRVTANIILIFLVVGFALVIYAALNR